MFEDAATVFSATPKSSVTHYLQAFVSPAAIYFTPILIFVWLAFPPYFLDVLPAAALFANAVTIHALPTFFCVRLADGGASSIPCHDSDFISSVKVLPLNFFPHGLFYRSCKDV